MFMDIKNAVKLSPTNSAHLVITGLMPAPPTTWKNYNKSSIFYMPNDIKQCFSTLYDWWKRLLLRLFKINIYIYVYNE